MAKIFLYLVEIDYFCNPKDNLFFTLLINKDNGKKCMAESKSCLSAQVA